MAIASHKEPAGGEMLLGLQRRALVVVEMEAAATADAPPSRAACAM